MQEMVISDFYLCLDKQVSPRIRETFYLFAFLNPSSPTLLLSYSLATCIYLECLSECSLLMLRTQSGFSIAKIL